MNSQSSLKINDIQEKCRWSSGNSWKLITWKTCFFSHHVCVANDSSLCCNCYPFQVVPGSGHILSNFIILTLEIELKTDVVTWILRSHNPRNLVKSQNHLTQNRCYKRIFLHIWHQNSSGCIGLSWSLIWQINSQDR